MYPAIVRGRTVWGVSRLVSNSLVSRASNDTVATSRRCFSADLKADSFVSGSSSIYVEDMYQQWQKDPNSVHPVSVTSIFEDLID
jgi:hypothetical protein